MKRSLTCVLAAFLIALAGCSTTSVGLKYAAPNAVQAAPAGSPAVSVGRFEDRRNESPTALGVIRSGFGSPLKNLVTNEPVSRLVAAAFADGLRARGYARADKPRYEISGAVLGFFCDQYARREAKAEIELTVTDVDGRKTVLTRRYSANQVEGTAFTPGAAFGSVERLRAVAERTLREVVDKALDDPAVRDALR